MNFGLCLVNDDRGRLYAYAVSLERKEAEPLFRLEAGGPLSLRVEDDEHFLVLDQHEARLRRYDRKGVLRDETAELNGEALKRPRGLVILEDGRVAVFQDLNRILIGPFPRREAESETGRLPDPLIRLGIRPVTARRPAACRAFAAGRRSPG